MGFPAARLLDMHVCPMVTGIIPHVGGPISGPCAPTVLIGCMPAARVTDMCVCIGPPDIIVKGSAGVMIMNLPAARMLDNCVHGGMIILGCFTVLIGEAAGGGGGGGSGGGGGAGGAGGGAAGGPYAGPPVANQAVYASPEDAARAALSVANPCSIRDNLEYGGNIYRDPATGLYGFTGPGRGTDAGFNPSSTPIPAGTTPAGDYHCHADYSTRDPVTGRAVRTSDPLRDDYNSDGFSSTDRRGIANDARGNPGYKGYLGTPSGRLLQYDPATNTTSPL